MDPKLSFEKLTNNNFFTWKYRMEMLLKKEGLWKVMDGIAPTETAALVTWNEKDEKAVAIIGLSVQDNQLQHIRNAKTAKESWKALKDFHEQNTLVNTTTLMRKLWDLKLTDDTNPQTHIETMTNLLQKLVDLGEPDLTEKWKTAILLSSLPDSYHTLVTALEARDPKDLKLTLVQSKVVDEFMRRNSQSNEDERVMKIQHNKPQKSCLYCKKKNHLIKDCLKLKNKNRSSVKDETKVNAIHEQNSSSESIFSLDESFCKSIKVANQCINGIESLDIEISMQ